MVSFLSLPLLINFNCKLDYYFLVTLSHGLQVTLEADFVRSCWYTIELDSDQAGSRAPGRIG